MYVLVANSPLLSSPLATWDLRTDAYSQQLELHIGYVYGDQAIPPSASHYTPKFVAGARLPHAWIEYFSGIQPLNLQPVDVSYVREFTENDVLRRQFSTLDLLDYDKFTLIVSPNMTWEVKAGQVQQLSKRAGVKVQVWVWKKDFDFVNENQASLFKNQGGFADGGGLVVRPDQHILGRLGQDTTAEEVTSLVFGHLGQVA